MKATSEIFKDVPGYEGLYQVSNMGQVKSLKFNKTKILKNRIDGGGYAFVSIFKNKHRKQLKVHQLVAMAFLGHKPCGLKRVIDHINHDKLDNKLNNLRIVTNRKNTSHKKTKGSSKFTGVTWAKHANKWIAHIRINGKQKHLGYYKKEIKAHEAYQKELKKLK